MIQFKDVPAARAMRRGGLAAVLGALLLALVIASPAAGATHVVWTDTYYGAPRLYRARLDGSFPTSRTLVPGSLPEGLAYDPVSNGLFVGEAAWSGAGILRTDAALTAPVPFTAGLSCVRGLAMDEGSGLLYWSTSNVITGSTIQYRSRDGTVSGQLFALGTSINPRGVAVDPAHGQVWWADFNNNAIERCNFDGSAGMVVWFSDPASRPYGIAYDRGTDRVYWTEYGSGRLMRADRDGTNITVLATGLGNPTHLALDAVGGRLYWVDAAYGQGRVRSAALNGTDLREIAALQTFGGIALVAGSVTDVPAGEPAIAYATALADPWPNPAPGAATVAFTLATEARVRLTVHDVAGRQVAVLADGPFGPGPHTSRWTADPGGAGSAAPGVYFVRLRVAGREWTRRLVLTR